MWRKRAVAILCLSLICFLGLVGRLMQLQLFETENFSKHNINLIADSVAQRSQEIVIDSGRGGFLDRNGVLLTKQKKPVLILFPFLKNTNWNVEKVASIIGVHSEIIRDAVNVAKKPFVFGEKEPLRLSKNQMNAINKLQIPGVFAVEKKFELDTNLAEHLIGITGENNQLLNSRYPDKKISGKTLIGLTGMEKSFDEFLLPEGEAKLVYHVDANGGPLFGINVKYIEPANPFYPVNIRTTIDAKLQQKSEEIVDKYNLKKGGLVLIDIDNNSVVSLVSRPSINRKDPFNNKTGGIENLMLKQQIVGSVFKTVVAAAAIENRLDDPNRLFNCSQTITGDVDHQYQYGQLNFKKSFAKSCNNTFATLAKELKDIDPNAIEDNAKKLSLIGKTGWVDDLYHMKNFKQLPDEDAGRVFLSEGEKYDRNYIALTGIGQHEVRASPLAVANMMATIARGGKKEMVRIASGIEYKNGTSLITFKEKKLDGETVSNETARKLQKLLREVVTNEEGTGRWLNQLPYEVAGKSGTGETGKFIKNEQLYNKWFAGYFPFNKPKYALVVVNLDVRTNQGGVLPIYTDIVKAIYDYNQNSVQP